MAVVDYTNEKVLFTNPREHSHHECYEEDEEGVSQEDLDKLDDLPGSAA